MDMKFWIFWGCLLIPTIRAGGKWWKVSDKDNTLFFGFMLLLISVLYSVVVLDLVVTNNTIKKVEVTKEEIKNIADLTVKVAFVLSDASSRLGGTPPEHKVKLEEYARELALMTKRNPAELLEEVNRTIKDLNDSLNKRIQNERK